METGRWDVPEQAREGADALRLQLLGLKMPGSDLHMYDPQA